MKSKIRKVTWLVWALLMLSGAGAWAATYSGTTGGCNWSFNTSTGVLTISKGEDVYTGRGSNRILQYAAGETENYHHTWYYPSDGQNRKTGDYEGTAPFSNSRSFNKSSIKHIVVEEGVVKLGAAIFAGLTNLEDVSLPNSLETISYEAFRECKKLESIHLGPNVCTLGDRWLTGTYSGNYYSDRTGRSPSTLDSMTTITVDPANTCFVVDKYGVLYTADYKTLVKLPQHLLIDEIVIPEGVTKIGDEAFYYCTGLTSLTIPNSVTKISYMAFYDCSGLTSLNIPNSVTEIGEQAFRQCSGLTSLNI